MGAVLGIAAFGRTQEKIAGSASNASTTTTPTTPSFTPSLSAAPSIPTPVPFAPGPAVVGFGGKAAPPTAFQPEL
jgi:hypothetical protein